MELNLITWKIISHYNSIKGAERFPPPLSSAVLDVPWEQRGFQMVGFLTFFPAPALCDGHPSCVQWRKMTTMGAAKGKMVAMVMAQGRSGFSHPQGSHLTYAVIFP